MKDLIAVRGIRAYGKHGALAEEREHAQLLIVDVELEVDTRRAQASDALADTIDYAEVQARVVAIVRRQSFALLERLAGEIAARLLEDERAGAVTVAVAKPGLLDGATPAVTVRRARGG